MRLLKVTTMAILLAGCNSIPTGDSGDGAIGSPSPLVDTDGDGLTDFDEVFRYGSNPAEADTDFDGLTDTQELLGYGSSSGPGDAEEISIFGSYPLGGTGEFHVSSPLLGDTDFDGLPDLLERELGSDPTQIDTDEDGLIDFNEFADFSTFIYLGTLFPGFVLDGTGSLALGTSLTDADTDGDGLTDFDEALFGWIVKVGNQFVSVESSPLLPDTDFDGLNDNLERLGADGIPPGGFGDTLDATNPQVLDTDDDGTIDGDEIDAGTNPLVPGLVVDVCLIRAELLGGVLDTTTNTTLWSFAITATVFGDSPQTELFATAPGICGGNTDPECSYGGAHIFSSNGGVCHQAELCEQLTVQEGDELVLFTEVGEWASCSDEVNVFNCIGVATTDFSFSTIQMETFIEATIAPELDGSTRTEGTAEFTIWITAN